MNAYVAYLLACFFVGIEATDFVVFGNDPIIVLVLRNLVLKFRRARLQRRIIILERRVVAFERSLGGFHADICNDAAAADEHQGGL